MAKLFNLAGRTALVTGSSRGLGRAIATGLAEAGAAVVLNGADGSRLAAAAADLRLATRHASTSPTRQKSSLRSPILMRVALPSTSW
jgi:NAD(P)-dependent dehydrogenase (short-subunit alcohol dehydrogenase family)